MTAITCLGLAGPAGVGKSTTAHALHLMDDRYRVVEIGRPLKNMLAEYYRTVAGFTADQARRRTDGDLKRMPCEHLGGKTPTEAMQTLGTEWGRDLDPDLWLRAWEKEASRLIWNGYIPVNDSVRFANEAEAIKRLGGMVVRLEGRGDPVPDHASETQDFGVDMVLDISTMSPTSVSVSLSDTVSRANLRQP